MGVIKVKSGEQSIIISNDETRLEVTFINDTNGTKTINISALALIEAIKEKVATYKGENNKCIIL